MGWELSTSIRETCMAEGPHLGETGREILWKSSGEVVESDASFMLLPLHLISNMVHTRSVSDLRNPFNSTIVDNV